MKQSGDSTSAARAVFRAPGSHFVPRDIRLLSAAFAFAFAAYGGVQQYVITYFNGQGRSNVGFISLILVYVAISICAPPAAVIVSHFGAKKAMLAALPFYSLFILSLASNLSAVVWAASITLGMAGAVLWNGQNTYLVRAAQEDAVGTSAGFFSMLEAVGVACGVVIVGIAVVRTSYVVTFLAAAVPPILGCLCILRMTDIRIAPRPNRLRHALSATRSLTAWRLSAVWFGGSFVFGLVLSVIPVAIQNTLGLAFVGVLTSCFYIVPMIASYVAGNRSDVRGRRALLLVGCVTGTSGLIALNFSQVPVALVGGVILLALCNATMAPVGMALAGDVANEKNLEAIVSLFRVMQGTGTVAGLGLATIVHGVSAFPISLVGLVICYLVAWPALRYDTPEIRRRITAEIG